MATCQGGSSAVSITRRPSSAPSTNAPPARRPRPSAHASWKASSALSAPGAAAAASSSAPGTSTPRPPSLTRPCTPAATSRGDSCCPRGSPFPATAFAASCSRHALSSARSRFRLTLGSRSPQPSLASAEMAWQALRPSNSQWCDSTSAASASGQRPAAASAERTTRCRLRSLPRPLLPASPPRLSPPCCASALPALLTSACGSCRVATAPAVPCRKDVNLRCNPAGAAALVPSSSTRRAAGHSRQGAALYCRPAAASTPGPRAAQSARIQAVTARRRALRHDAILHQLPRAQPRWAIG
mmetsp:Transcript_15670/g.39845  ORF Transcript_15670/g.39845 Transcript_15670/m.39845 type:complete len:299 (-) Transcript_15670:314-1210(-)